MTGRKSVLILLLALIFVLSAVLPALAATSGPTVQPGSGNVITAKPDIKVISSIKVTAPAANQKFRLGGQMDIRWQYSGFAGKNVKLTLLRNGQPFREIEASVPIGTNGEGSYLWQIPEDLELQNGFRIEVKSVEAATVKAVSEEFCIVCVRVQVTTPNGGESIFFNQRYNIGVITSNSGPLKLVLLKDGAEVMTIEEQAYPNSWVGLVYSWYIPALQNGALYQIKAISKDFPDVYDVSDSYFHYYYDPKQLGH